MDIRFPDSQIKFFRTHVKFVRIAYISLGVILLGIVLVFSIVNLQSHPYIEQEIELLGEAQVAIVLGAAILPSGEISQIFKDRADTATLLYAEGIVDRILVSGDDGTTTHNEVNPAREYLLDRGVPSDAIFLDHAGFDTYSSMYRAREIFKVQTAIITTQPFHLPRAVFIARRLGINAHGFPAVQHQYGIKNNFRELFADMKAVVNLIFHRQPKYLGKEIPITGSSIESI